MMPAQCSLASNLALLVLLGTVRAGPFSPRANMTLPAPRPPPQPGGRTGGGSPSSRLYEHTVEGGEKQVVFTHRINLPPSAGCGCPPGTEPPVPASEVQALRVRLEILEELVKGLKEQCTGGCCPAAAQAGTGQTDVRTLCSLHGVFDLSRCACSCEPGWGGPTCSDPMDSGVSPSSPPSASGSCPDDCNDQGRCVRGRCVCFPGYTGPSCSWPSCPGDCQGRGRCVQGVCVCRAGFSGDDCSLRSCPRGCSQRGRCEDGRCVCDPGYTGEDCGMRSCPRGCSQKGRCEDGRCVCDPGYTGDDCGSRSCPWDCGEGGRCADGRCVCNPGFTGEDCGSRRCPGDCRGRGRCDDGVCLCDAGYEGEDCGSRSCPGGCRGRGQCLEGRCVCDDGYEGEDCGVRRCPRDCSQRGVCQDGVCTCWEGYAGEDCSLRTCPSNCHRRGRCENGRCVCDSGYTGPSCSTRTCPADCRGRGRCVQGVCVCHLGYSGEDCGQEEPPASACPGGCGPRELCREGQCVCVEGFRGPDCAIQTCPGDCRGRGDCQEGRCICQDGYAGEDCGEEVPAIEGMRMHLLEETTVRTEWTRAPGNVDAYEIQFIPTTEGESPPFTARVPSSASAYDQRGLAPGQEYQVTVRALRGTNWGPPASKTITTMIDGPQDLRVVAVTPTTLELNWMRPQAEVDRFVVSYVSAGNQRVRLEVPPEADGTLLTGLMPGVEYVVTVTAERGRAVSYPASVRANTGSSPLGLLGATDEPPPSGPSTTQGAQAPVLQQRPQELGELRVLGRDKTGRLRVAWTAQPDTFAHFQLRLRVPEGPGAHEELLPGDVHQALVPSPPPGSPYELSLRGVPPEGEPSAPLIYQGIMDRDGEKPGKPLAPPRLGKLSVTDVTSSSLLLHWTVPEGEFDSFMIQYKDRDGPQVVPVEGPQRSALISNLDVGRKYKFVLYGLVGKRKHGPLVTEAKILAQTDPSPGTPPRLGMLWVTDPTPDSLHLSWTVPEGQFDSFVVQYRDRDGRPQVVPVEGPERSVVVSPLDPDHKYRFTLFGIANRKRHGPLTADGTTAPEKREEPLHPESPQQPLLGELAVTGATPDSLHLSWTVAQGSFDSFTVQYKDAQGRPQVVPVRGDENEVTIPGLESDRKYKMNLYGLHGRQRVGPVSVVATTALQEIVDETPSPAEVEETPSPTEPSTEAPEPPEEPLLGELTVTGSSPDSLSLSWTVPQGHFDSFTVQHRDRDGQPKVMRVPGHEDGVTVLGLEPDHKYKMNLYGFHNGQRLGPVSVIGVTTPQPEETPPATEPPLEPRLGELTVTDVTPNSVGLAWTVPEGQFDSFVVQYKDRDGQPQAVPVAADQREVTVPGLEPARKYKMNFYGLHGGQRVGPLAVVAVTAPLPPAPATEHPLEPRLGELTVTYVTPDSVGLSWTIPEGKFDSFVVQYKDRDGQPQVVPVASDQREVTVPGLEPSRKYKFLLFGILDGKRHSSVSVEAKTAARGDASLGAPPRLGELWVTDPTPDSLRLSWTVPEGHFDSFVVQFKDRDGPQVVPVEGHERSVTVAPLDANRKYKFLLYGLLGKKRHGPLSAEGTTGTQSAVDEARTKHPSKPRLGEELQVTSVTSDSVGLSWMVPEGQFDSFVVQYKDRDGQPQVVPVDGSLREVSILGLDPARRYKLLLYGLHKGRRVGPISAITETAPKEEMEAETEAPSPPASEPHLGEVTVEEATPHTLHLSWMVTEGEFDSFEVQYTDKDGQLQVVRLGGDQNDITLSDLESDHKYLVSLYGFHNGQSVGPVHVEALTAPREEEDEPSESPSTTPEPPIKPRLGKLAVTDASPDSLSLSWTVPEGQFDHFLVQYKNGDGQPKAVRVPGHQDGVTVSGLEPDHKYKMNLYGFHEGQRLGPVSTIGLTASLTTEPPLPPQLRELTVAAVGSDTVRLLWTVAQGPFDSFLVQYKDVQGQPQAVPVGGDLREVTVSGLAPARKYKFLLFGLQDEKRHGPVSADAKTLPDTKPSPRLGELTVTDMTPDSMILSWTVAEGEFDSFVVQYKDRDGQPHVVPVAADQREITIPGLEPNRKYKFLLYGLAGSKRLGPISADGSTAPLEKERQPPPRLGELTVTDETLDSLRLLWTVAQGPFDSFVVQFRDTDRQPRVVPVAADQREVTIEGLEPGRKYKFLLYGLHRGQRLGPISVLGVTAPEEDTPAPWHSATEAPEPPEGPRLGALAVSDMSPDSLRLSWSVARGSFDSFVVQYQDTDAQPQALLVGGNQNKILVSGLEPSTSYTFFLYGLHEGKRLGPVSAEGTTGPAPAGQSPGEPGPRLSHLSVTDVTTSSLRLNWEAPHEAFDSFLLRFGVPSPSTLEPHPRPLLQRELTVPGTRRSAVLRDLRPGTLYTLTLYGLRGPHKADSIQGTARTLSPVLESPRDLQFSEIRETSAKVSWVPPPSRVDSFKVSYQLADGGEPLSVQVDGRARTQKLEGLIPGARYEVTVVSVRGFEESEPLTGFLTTVPDGPTQLRALNLTEGSALLHWKPPQAPVDTYDVKVTAPGAPSLQASAPGSAVDYPLHDLVLHTNYTATLRGLRGPNLTSPASITFTTGLEAPQNLEAKEVTPRTVLLTWTAPQVTPTGYLLSFNTPGGQIQEILLPGGVTSHQLSGLFPSTPYSAWLRAMWGQSFTPPVSTSFTTGGLRIPFPRDCGEEMQNGVSTSRTTTIFLNGNRERPLNVFCDMETDGGGWLVFQRRMDGKTDFWRDWEDYAHGFGNLSGEFWLGNEALHSLTKAGDYSLRVDLRDGDEAVFAQYDSFQVDSAAEYYRLHLDGYHGTAGDSMSYHSGSVFSARDRDPNNLLISCAVSYRGAWWYRNCHYANLNGLYGSTVDHQGVSWYYWKGFDFSIPFTEMKLRPRSYRPPGRGS
nr:tenascin-X isoform X1 [Vicugna pacos]